VIPFTDEYHGTKLTIKEAGKRYGTPMLLVMIAIGQLTCYSHWILFRPLLV